MSNGTYTHQSGVRGFEWLLQLDPAVRMRARRLFGKVQLTRTKAIVIADTDEVCRDLAWFMQRFPLEPGNEWAAERLQQGATAHTLLEQQVAAIITGQAPRDRPAVTSVKEPREYQLLAVDLLRARKRLLLTDEVGLGKTLTGLLAVAHRDARPALIVPPTHLPPRWQTEAEESFPDLSFAVAKKSTPTTELRDGLPDVLVVPYSKLDGWAGYLAGQVRTVVFDEVQELRNGLTTNKGSAAALVTQDATYVLGLTATPVYNYGSEIWNLYDILAPGELGTREEFNREWGGAQASNGQTLVADPHALGSHLRTEGLMLGRTRHQVGRELPKTIKAPTLVDSNHKALNDARTSLEHLAAKILSTTTTPQEKFQASGEIDWRLRRATGIDKAPFVADYVRMLLDSEDRIVLWGWHRDVYRIWMDMLTDFNPALYTGSETPKQKHDAQTRFTAPYTPGDSHATRILIMSLRSGAGIDGLQKVARVGVFGELDWSPQVHEQAIGRLRRDGMKDDPPVIFFLYTADGSDPILLDTLQLKRQQSEPLITHDGNLLGNATLDPNRGRLLAQQLLTRQRTTT